MWEQLGWLAGCIVFLLILVRIGAGDYYDDDDFLT